MNYSGSVWYRHHKCPDGSPAEWPSSVLSRQGEAVACQHLDEMGYTVTGQDVFLMQEEHEPWSIVDIVAQDPSGACVLVTVHAAYSDDIEDFPKVDYDQEQESEMVVATKKYFEEYPEVDYVRHDYVSVLLFDDNNANVSHIEGVCEVR